MDAAAAAPIYAKPRVTGYEIASWVFVAFLIFFTLFFHLLPALLAGLFVYSLVHRVAMHLTEYKFPGARSKLLALTIVSILLVGVSAGIIFAFLAVLKGRVGGMHELTLRLTDMIREFREWVVKRGLSEQIPEAPRLLQLAEEQMQDYTRHHALQTAKHFLHALVGIVIGALLSFRVAHPAGPLSAAFTERAERFALAFKQVVFAQIKISALNTAFTSIYLLVVLPLCGINLPFKSTLVVVTFVAGLLPVIGNLISNTVIFLISLSVGNGVAIASLVYLIVIHKLEYFLNAKIVGGEIKASAWEILLAMLCFEAAFGISGIIIAPIVYAYAKAELRDKQLI